MLDSSPGLSDFRTAVPPSRTGAESSPPATEIYVARIVTAGLIVGDHGEMHPPLDVRQRMYALSEQRARTPLSAPPTSRIPICYVLWRLQV